MRIALLGRTTKIALASALAIALVMVGTIGFSASAQDADARVRITHASPDAPAVDIWVDGAPAVTDLAFGESTDLIPLPAGDYLVQVTPAGSTDPEADAVISATLTLDAGQAYDVVATGLLADIQPSVYPLDLSPLADGSSRVEVIHASPDAPAVNIVANGTTLFADLMFPESSGFADVPAGSYDVQVVVAESGAVALDLPGTVLESGQVYNFIAVGQVADGSLTVLPLAAPADTAVGGASTADATPATGGETATTDESSTAGTQAVPATGVGSMASSTSSSLLTMVALAAGLLFLGGMIRGRSAQPVRLRK